MTTFTRHRMSLDLAELAPGPHALAGFRIQPIADAGVEALARLSIDCYTGTPDWDLVPELQSLDGCRTFIQHLFSGEQVFGGEQGAFRSDLSFVLLKGEELCGAIYTLCTEDTAYIIDFAVAPGHRGRGVGRMLLWFALERYKAVDYSKAVLFVTASNEPAVRLYIGAGFRVEDTHTVTVGETGT